MADLTLSLIFSGLIAFLPNSSLDPEFMTAYVLKDRGFNPRCPHRPVLIIRGKRVEQFEILQDSHACDSASDVMNCVLRDTDISLDPPPIERQRFIREQPTALLPEDFLGGENIAWLVRMSNLERVAGRIKPWNELDREGLIGARFRFGWDSTRTCMFDEGGNERVHVFEFVNARDTSGHQQAIAETLMFNVRISAAGPIKIILSDRSDSKKRSIIRLRCPGGRCPLVRVSNDAVCDECAQSEEFGYHFDAFYYLSRESKKRFIPHRIPDKYVPEENVSKHCGLDFAFPKSESRIICPPALFEP